ncbi:ABC-2 type transporter [Gordonia bronchialis DSM 43247]|uniref:ABC-2 type transporter n=1 Tax=Gordonia bronchialis (strain ATCC 25592 / DSM 43247 / BCRC 13721 / JCM 3198 / KCTC 3076 / NBRC 16047 / NCTC 10667) TaxID=526226 RepID=D0L2L7_GORB4|nr:ABC transporter permease [Gordonia bronchialis]ACY22920.1 ABC-2 type transporter [Gordonia bronchialis DSM 43247]MCC3325698.1 ABC transporter permease [Gordonia bronchialis]QGS23647.1 ABC transporter [Gordonia bronchialis]STQ65866.1 Doxorubicin resistance ABC transporter permease protein drrB [Gordonia bronchialis]
MTTEHLLDAPHITSRQQWWALTARGLGSLLRSGEVILALIAPAFLAVCFYLPLRSIMNQYPGMNYAQFLMPIITLQSISFVASSAAMRSSFDRAHGINTRFRTMPMHISIPALARISTSLVLLAIALCCATAVCLVIGWRPQGGVSGTVGLYAIAVAVGAAVALIADGIGLLASSPEATSQALALPVLILGMLSTGFVPESQFPDWIAPFARNQPVSQFANAMRAFNENTATPSVILPAVWWFIGLFVLGAVLLYLGMRKAQR